MVDWEVASTETRTLVRIWWIWPPGRDTLQPKPHGQYDPHGYAVCCGRRGGLEPVERLGRDHGQCPQYCGFGRVLVLIRFEVQAVQPPARFAGRWMTLR